MKSSYPWVSGVVFGLVALFQLIRAVGQWPVHIGAQAVPVGISWALTLVAGGLCVWAFRSGRSRP